MTIAIKQTIEVLFVREHLKKLGLEDTVVVGDLMMGEDQLHHIEKRFAGIIACLNLYTDNPAIVDTPRRVSRMYCEELFYGLNYDKFPDCTVFPNVHKYDEVVAIKDISVRSMCEHHFLPFIGTAKIGYIPKDKILGLSKFNRIVDFYSRRPQIQERLVQQIHAALSYILDTDDVAVVVSATHYCTVMRGVKDSNSSTSTSKMSGRFMSNPALRSEFFQL